MEKVFLVHNEITYTYEKLLADLNNKASRFSYVYVKDNHPYEVFLAIIHSLLLDYPIEVLDGDFSEAEVVELGINVNEVTVATKVKQDLHFYNLDEVIRRIQAIDKWHLTLYTSGTTGRPKKVSHAFHTLTRTVKIHRKFDNDVWAFAYNPTHMAGLQVFFQAFLNQNTLIYIFGESMKRASELIEAYEVTNISATATFYRNVLPYMQGNMYLKVNRVTFGGEKIDLFLEDKLKGVFPNAKMINIYASTEAGSLFAAQSDTFEIREEYQQWVKITAQ
ncbi:MAG: AMP-binding protein, partial [Carnobacterium sp.]